VAKSHLKILVADPQVMGEVRESSPQAVRSCVLDPRSTADDSHVVIDMTWRGSQTRQVTSMLKKTLSLAFIGASLMLPAPSASAHTPGCVSRSEFQAVKPVPRGEWRMAKVHSLFDTDGTLYRHPYPGTKVRQYRACNGDKVRVTYGFYHVWLAEKKRWIDA